MKFQISAELDYTALEPCTFVLNIHALRHPQTILRESFTVDAGHDMDELDSYPEGNRIVRISVKQPGNIHGTYKAVVENSYRMINLTDKPETSITAFDPVLFTYLHPSRYCQSDKLVRLANHQFGEIDNEFSQVLAITEWINKNVEYLSGSTNAETSAYDTVTQQAGVCRDFAHLGIALCRALTIPARYCSVYAYQLEPQDFHACFEAYISGHWIVFDATKLAPLNGFVKIATGRDAADTAIANLFGNVYGNYITVSSNLDGDDFIPLFYDSDNREGISYD
jgi:transglutaminase-like putative cysteine protease